MDKQSATYLVVVNDTRHESETIHAPDIVEFLFKRNVWIFQDRTPHLGDLKPGDKLIVYLAGKPHAFAAEAMVSSRPERLGTALRDEVQRIGLGLSRFNWSVKISNQRTLRPPRPIHELLPDLRFIANKKNYGLSLRQGLRRIDDKDAKVIVGK